MPNRLIRDWTKSEKIDALSEGAEVFFTRLIMKADDFGCYTGNLKLLSADLYPLRNVMPDEVKRYLTECVSAGVVYLYRVEKKDYVFIPNFGQRLRAFHRKFPEPVNMLTGKKIDPPTPDRGPPSHDGHMTDNGRPEVEVEVEEEEEVEEEVENEAKRIADIRPPFDGELLAAWKNWENYRKEKRVPLTKRSRDKQIELLRARAPSDAVAMINNSITNGYTGLFDPKTNGSGNRKTEQTNANRKHLQDKYGDKFTGKKF